MVRKTLILTAAERAVGARWRVGHRAASKLSPEELAALGRQWATVKIAGFARAEVAAVGPLSDHQKSEIIAALNGPS